MICGGSPHYWVDYYMPLCKTEWLGFCGRFLFRPIVDSFETVGALHLEARFRHLYTFMIGLKFCHDKIDVKVKECPKAFYI